MGRVKSSSAAAEGRNMPVPARVAPRAEAAAPRALIGFGEVRHTRLRPKHHAFRYDAFFLFLPMRSLARDPAAAGALAVDRAAPIGFRSRDHGDGGEHAPGVAGALHWLDRLLAAAGIHDATGEAWLHCFPRVLGYAFKPVSFWYCHAPSGALRAIVVEVNNTFGERHCYLIDRPVYGMVQTARKVFHVSPFCEARGDYQFRFFVDEHRTRTLVRIDHALDGEPLLQTSVGGRLQPIDPAALRRALWTYPAMGVGVMARIHWQAARLWLKKVPFFRKPPAPSQDVSHANLHQP